MPEPASGGTLVLGVVGEPPTLDPDRSRDPAPSGWLTELGTTWERAGATAGLEVVYEPRPGSEPLLDRLVVRFVQTLEIAIVLLEEGRLDAAVLPSSVNLLERLDERGLNAGAALRDEVVYLDMRGTEHGYPARSTLAALTEKQSLADAFVRNLGRPVTTFAAGAGSSPRGGPFARLTEVEPSGSGRLVQMAVPVGDELLALVQRALHDDWEDHGFEVDVITIDARTFYGDWAGDPPVDVALRRGSGPGLPADRRAFRSLDAVPLFQVATVLAWRDGVHGIDPTRRRAPFATTERWWVDDG